MKRKIEVLLNPLFIVSIVLLLFNDFILKHNFHNFITGKLSDFTGLFAFTLFLAAIFPKYKKFVSVFIIIFFIFWKSPLSQPLIDSWNSIILYSVGRTVDYSDLIALPIVWLAYKFSLYERKIILKKYLTVPVAMLALFSFCATSYMHVYQINKSFEIALSKQEVIKRINDICRTCENYLPLSTDVQRADTSFVNVDMDTVYYSVTGYSHYDDTLWNYDRNGQKTCIDTIYHYKYIDKDTMYVGNSGFFILHYNVKDYLELKEENYCGCVEARCRISGIGNKSVLTFITADAGPCTYIKAGDDGAEQLINAFEKGIIERIKH
ncbi:MAG: hypothetical protein V1904_14415 [Bacteroidota bacterium]